MVAFFSSAYRALIRALRFLRMHLKATVATFVVLLIGWTVFAVTRPKQPVYVTAVAERGELRQTVEAVGTVISEKDLSLQFPTIDVVSKVYVKEGDRVKAGQRLATLRSGTLAAGVSAASAGLQSAQAALDQLLEGSRPEDIAIAEAQVANKQASLDAVKQTLKNAEDNLKNSEYQLTALKSEAGTSLSGLVTNASSIISQQLALSKTALQSTRGVFDANDVQDAVVKSVPSGYDALLAGMASRLSELSSLQLAPSPSDYLAAIASYEKARTVVQAVTDLENRAYDTVSQLSLTDYFTSTSRETNKTTIATQKSSVQTALATLDSSLKALKDASAGYDTKISAQNAEIASLKGTRDRAKADILTYETSLRIDVAQLDLKRAPARATDVDAAKARVRQASAELSRASAQLSDTVLSAPVDGIVTKVNVKAGEVRPSSEPSVTMLGTAPYRIEMFVSEVDIPKIKLSQSGSIRLDAFQKQDIPLRVSEIDSAATDKDGVSKYRVKLDFVMPNDDLKVGMTGDAEITTGVRSDVVSVPLRSVLDTEVGTKIVRILNADGKSFTERPVATGMEGAGGNVEVTGVTEGETVIVLVKE